MQRIRITRKTVSDKYWLVYYTDRQSKKHINLSGCAGNFELTTGYKSNDGLKAVGWHYEENGQMCYELFNVGHTVLYIPLQPGLFFSLRCFLRMKKPKEEYRVFLKAFETALNQGGWKTITREEVWK